MNLRASMGTLSVLGLKKVRMDCPLTTGYFMVGGGCRQSCAFCTQSLAASRGKDKLSRIRWPSVEVELLRERKGAIHNLSRVCFQCVDSNDTFRELGEMLRFFREEIEYRGEISASLKPLGNKKLTQLKENGLDNICLSLDVPTPELFDDIKGGNKGRNIMVQENPTDPLGSCQFKAIQAGLDGALKVFGKGNVTTHLIVGLGETDREILQCIGELKQRSIRTGLFAFMPMSGTPLAHMERPEIARYRAIQMATDMIETETISFNDLEFDIKGKITGPGEIFKEYSSVKCFETRGCDECNRPYYNETPLGYMYNYPRPLTSPEGEKAKRELARYLNQRT